MLSNLTERISQRTTRYELLRNPRLNKGQLSRKQNAD